MYIVSKYRERIPTKFGRMPSSGLPGKKKTLNFLPFVNEKRKDNSGFEEVM